MSLHHLASEHQRRRNEIAERATRAVLRTWAGLPTTDLEAGWDIAAPVIGRTVTKAQTDAATLAVAYVAASARLQGLPAADSVIEPATFAGATREGREIIPELYASVTTTKSLVGAGRGVGEAFQAGTALMSVMASTLVRDAGLRADRAAGVATGFSYSVRVVQPGACSRCAILAGRTGYRTDFNRHPRCRCTSMLIRGTNVPEGFFGSPEEYFESLSKAEQERVFTKAGAQAIRAGASPISVVNARRGAYGIGYSSRSNIPWRPGDTRARLQPVTIGYRKDGSPLQVYATTEGTTVRGSWGRRQSNFVKSGNDRYRRTRTLRLMPEQIMSMSTSPEQAVDLLRQHGYLR